MSVSPQNQQKTPSASGVPEEQAPTGVPTAAGHPLASWRGQMDRLFDDFFRGWGASPFGLAAFNPAAAPELASPGGLMLAPRIDVTETRDGVEISAELPGLDEKDVKVTLHEGVLTIEGEKKQESERKEADVWHSERHYGSFRRRFTLPDSLDAEKVSAKFDKGVLKVTIARKAGSTKPEPRSIPIG